MRLQRFSFVLLCLVLLLVALPTTGIAEDSTFVYDDFVCEEIGGTITISEYIGTSADVIVPGYIKGLKVEIGFCAFGEAGYGDTNETLQTVTIEDGVYYIHRYAFRFCVNLSKVIIPNSVLVIDEEAFYGCESLTEVSIPVGVNKIYQKAFSGCDNLRTVKIYNPNVDFQLGSRIFGSNYDISIYGYTGSTAQSYAESFGHTFIPFDDQPTIEPCFSMSPNPVNPGTGNNVDFNVSGAVNATDARMKCDDTYYSPVFKINNGIGAVDWAFHQSGKRKITLELYGGNGWKDSGAPAQWLTVRDAPILNAPALVFPDSGSIQLAPGSKPTFEWSKPSNASTTDAVEYVLYVDLNGKNIFKYSGLNKTSYTFVPGILYTEGNYEVGIYAVCKNWQQSPGSIIQITVKEDTSVFLYNKDNWSFENYTLVNQALKKEHYEKLKKTLNAIEMWASSIKYFKGWPAFNKDDIRINNTAVCHGMSTTAQLFAKRAINPKDYATANGSNANCTYEIERNVDSLSLILLYQISQNKDSYQKIEKQYSEKKLGIEKVLSNIVEKAEKIESINDTFGISYDVGTDGGHTVIAYGIQHLSKAVVLDNHSYDTAIKIFDPNYPNGGDVAWLYIDTNTWKYYNIPYWSGDNQESNILYMPDSSSYDFVSKSKKEINSITTLNVIGNTRFTLYNLENGKQWNINGKNIQPDSGVSTLQTDRIGGEYSITYELPSASASYKIIPRSSNFIKATLIYPNSGVYTEGKNIESIVFHPSGSVDTVSNDTVTASVAYNKVIPGGAFNSVAAVTEGDFSMTKSDAGIKISGDLSDVKLYGINSTQSEETHISSDSGSVIVKGKKEDGNPALVVMSDEDGDGFFESDLGASSIPGDVTGDGVIDEDDLIRLFKYLAEWDDLEINLQNAHVTGHSEVSEDDYIRLFKYVAEWDDIVLETYP